MTEALAIGVPVLLALVMNGVIYGTGMNARGKKNKNPWLPPGYVIAIVWIVIFGLLGHVYCHVERKTTRWFIVATIAFCLSYPLITGLRVSRIEMVMNALTLVIAIAGTMLVYYDKKKLVGWMVPFVAWATYVNMATLP